MPMMSTSPSMRPSSRPASANSRSASARVVASPDHGMPSTSFATSSARSGSRSTQSTFAPDCDSAWAACRPMPCPAPMRTKFRPSSRSRDPKSGTSLSSVLVNGARHLGRVERAVGRDRRGRLDVELLELRDDLLPEQLERLHDRLVRQVAELDVADQLVDAEVVVLDHLLVALVGVTDDDHVRVAEDLGVELAALLHLEQREDLVLLLLAEVRELPLER